MGVSKESISKFLIGNRFHVKLRILSPYSNRSTTHVLLNTREQIAVSFFFFFVSTGNLHVMLIWVDKVGERLKRSEKLSRKTWKLPFVAGKCWETFGRFHGVPAYNPLSGNSENSRRSKSKEHETVVATNCDRCCVYLMYVCLKTTFLSTFNAQTMSEVSGLQKIVNTQEKALVQGCFVHTSIHTKRVLYISVPGVRKWRDFDETGSSWIGSARFTHQILCTKTGWNSRQEPSVDRARQVGLSASWWSVRLYRTKLVRNCIHIWQMGQTSIWDCITFFGRCRRAQEVKAGTLDWLLCCVTRSFLDLKRNFPTKQKIKVFSGSTRRVRFAES